MLIINTKLPKLCHAQIGGTVRLTGPDGEPMSELFIVSTFNEKGRRAGRSGMMHGLYDEERPLFLTSLASGEAVPMPHLSSRVEIVRDVAVVEGTLPASDINSNTQQFERDMTKAQKRIEGLQAALTTTLQALDQVVAMDSTNHTKQSMATRAEFTARNVRKTINKLNLMQLGGM